MKKFLLALFLLPVLVWAQASVTVTTQFKIRKVLIARQTSTLLSAVATTGDPDTLQQIDITGTVIDTIIQSPYAASLNVIKFYLSSTDPISGRERSRTYTDTLRWGEQHIIPYAAGSGIADSLFYITMDDSSGLTESFRIILRPVNEVRISGDTLTTKPEFSITADSLNTF